MDPLHTYHNFITKLIFSESVWILKLSHLIEAAAKTKDDLLVTILSGAYDKHSHRCTEYVATSQPLVTELRKLGYHQEATILKIIGSSWNAWRRPHQTQRDRTEALRLLSVMIYRLFGRFMFDVRALRVQHFGGFPTNQWLL